MTQNPVIHTHHFGDIRESIFSKLEWLFRQNTIITSSSNKQFYYFALRTLYDTSELGVCDICAILTHNGVIIHTAFPKQPNVFERVWTISSFIGYITYIEISNPDLRYHLKYDPLDPEGNAYELHANLVDCKLLETLLISVIRDVKNNDMRQLDALNPTISNLLTG